MIRVGLAIFMDRIATLASGPQAVLSNPHSGRLAFSDGCHTFRYTAGTMLAEWASANS
jgi:hypothetical protein